MSATERFDFTLDGRSVNAQPGETILQAAQRQGFQIPRLCFSDNLRADGNCRACVVEIDGERSLAPSCCRAPSPGMVVQASSERAIKSQKMVLELLLADLPDQGSRWVDGDAARPHGELSDWAARLGVTARPALVALRREQPAPDLSHPAMAVNTDSPANFSVRRMRLSRITLMSHPFTWSQSSISSNRRASARPTVQVNNSNASGSMIQSFAAWVWPATPKADHCRQR